MQSLLAGTLGRFCCTEAIPFELDRELFWRADEFTTPMSLSTSDPDA
jgi:hypothetical protein